MERLVPNALLEFLESYGYECVAALTDASAIEIILLPDEPAEEDAAARASLRGPAAFRNGTR